MQLSTSVLWDEHMKQVHGTNLSDEERLRAVSMAEISKELSVDSQTCPMCLKAGIKTRKEYVTHVSKHMESIALAALPRDADFDSGSDLERESNGTETEIKDMMLKSDNSFSGDQFQNLLASLEPDGLEQQNHAGPSSLELRTEITYPLLENVDAQILMQPNRDSTIALEDELGIPMSLDGAVEPINVGSPPSASIRRRNRRSSGSGAFASSLTAVASDINFGLNQSIGPQRDFERFGVWRLEVPSEDDRDFDTLHYEIQPSQETQFQAEMGKTDSISVSHSSERLAEIKDQASPGENAPMAFRHAPPDSLLVPVTQGQNTLTSNSAPVPSKDPPAGPGVCQKMTGHR
jgi:hypothetical protein